MTAELTDGQKEIQQLQTRILSLEETINSLKKGGDESKSAQAKIVELENQLKAVLTEKDELQKKIWDGKNRRGKERRNVPSIDRLKKEDDDNDDEKNPWGGHF